MRIAQSERAALADLLAAVGPDHPTLCGEWRTRDLAAHLVVRERRPDAALGILVPRLSRRTERIQAKAARRPYDDLVRAVRTGPPRWSPMRIPALDRLANTFEYFVHHEDVRRAALDWSPREADPERYRTLLRLLRRSGRLLLRRSPVTVRLDPQTDEAITIRAVKDAGSVIIEGTPDEITMFVFGRDEQSQVQLRGDNADVAALRRAKRGV